MRCVRSCLRRCAKILPGGGCMRVQSLLCSSFWCAGQLRARVSGLDGSCCGIGRKLSSCNRGNICYNRFVRLLCHIHPVFCSGSGYLPLCSQQQLFPQHEHHPAVHCHWHRAGGRTDHPGEAALPFSGLRGGGNAVPHYSGGTAAVLFFVPGRAESPLCPVADSRRAGLFWCFGYGCCG